MGGGIQKALQRDLDGDLLLSSGQVQVWFSLQPKVNSFALDSEVGRLVTYIAIMALNLLC